MIGAAASQIADAIRRSVSGALGEGAVVSVYPAEPETAAAPCVWLTFVGASCDNGGVWTITFEASVVADAALGALDAQDQLGAMTSAVLLMDCPGVIARNMTARGGGLTTRFGDTPHPVHLVEIPQLSQVC